MWLTHREYWSWSVTIKDAGVWGTPQEGSLILVEEDIHWKNRINDEKCVESHRGEVRANYDRDAYKNHEK